MTTMLAFFPDGHDDELLYSILARYHLMTGNTSSKRTLINLFGIDTIYAVIDLPSHIRRLCCQLPENESLQPEFIIEKHTLFPYYAPFLPEDRVKTCFESMTGDDGPAVHFQAGIMGSGIPSPLYLRYCPLCLVEEEERLGQAYWHRLHQVSGVMVCEIHKIPLQNSIVPYTLRQNRHYFEILNPIIDTKTDHNFRFEPSQMNHLLFIVDQVKWLLQNKVKCKSLNDFREFYISRLKTMGYVTDSGVVRFRKLLPVFTKFYGDSFLHIMHSQIDPHSNDTWLHRLLRKPRYSCHPLRHVLLLGFLDETVPSLFSPSPIKNSSLPFGNGPWPCLNNAAAHFNENVVSTCSLKIDQKKQQPIGTFICSCGYIYSRVGPDTDIQDRYIGRVKEYGHEWIARLNELSKANLSMRKLARLLGVDIKTVKKYILLQREKEGRETENKEQSNELMILSSRREQWRSHIEMYPSFSRTELRKSNPAVYSWLYRHDHKWLMENLPKRITPRNISFRVNWWKRDDELVLMVARAVEAIMAANPPIRITTSRIGKHIQRLSLLEKQLDKLPKTKEFLRKATESVEEFRIRRVKFVATHLRSDQTELTPWKIIRESGLRPGYGPLVEACILNEISCSASTLE
jgi:hypothetical protein